MPFIFPRDIPDLSYPKIQRKPKRWKQENRSKVLKVQNVIIKQIEELYFLLSNFICIKIPWNIKCKKLKLENLGKIFLLNPVDIKFGIQTL